MIVKVANPAVEVVKEAVWLAWKACGGPTGMGFFQDFPGATKDQVWQVAMAGHDVRVGGEQKMGEASAGRIYADYVFGRMMKLQMGWDNTTSEVFVPDHQPRDDYQGWSLRYTSYTMLVEEADKSLKAIV